jgi:Fe-S cluster biogenesis protein NfuA/nitrite reductase/ring-hydroxylating ferredoxin subunit
MPAIRGNEEASMQEDMQERQHRAERIEALIQEVSEFSDPHARDVAEELIQALLDLYGEGLARVLELTVQAGAPGYKIVESLASDDLVGSLLLLHELHPRDIETRVVEALDGVRPYLKSHGGNVELVSVEDGVAHLRLEGSCHGCPSSTMTLKLTIEEAIFKAAPDLDRLEVEGVTDPPRPPARVGTPVTFVPPRRTKDGSTTSISSKDSGIGKSEWNTVDGLASLPAGTLKTITVAEEPLIFCQLGGTYYAYYDRCSRCRSPLESSKLEGAMLICSSCGQQYDLYHAGRSKDTSDLFLEPVPLLVEGSRVKVTLSALNGNKAALSASAG